MAINLKDHQLKAIKQMKNGCILYGGVGSGKSRTALAYYYTQQGGSISDTNIKMKEPKDLYIITTARKRDELDWEGEMVPFLMSSNPETNPYSNNIVIDSWNNIKKYSNVYGAFFIFDEQRLVGSGAWVKAFYKIAKKNKWILLSATPGDTWSDYIPVFVANGFYKNKTEFGREHVIWSPYTNYPKIDGYMKVGKLIRHRHDILVPMDFKRETVQNHQDIIVNYDRIIYKTVMKEKWNVYKDAPIENASELCYTLRRIVNSDDSRINEVKKIVNERQKVIIFYNFDYELEILKNADYGKGFKVAEWNGHNHQPLPKTKRWVYLVNYGAGAEGWNCTSTDTIIFYSMNYAYKVMIQSSGRIDRMNTPYTDLYYYHLKSQSPIDLSISRALKSKKNFNERSFASSM